MHRMTILLLMLLAGMVQAQTILKISTLYRRAVMR